MRVLVVSNMFPSAKDPTYGTFVKQFCQGLERFGNEVDYAVIRGRSGVIEKVWRYIAFYMAVVAKGLRGRSDIIYVHYILHIAPLLLVLSMICKKTVILNVHGGDVIPRNMFHRALFWFAKRLARRASGIVVPSGWFRDLAARRLGVSEERFYVWPSSGVDLSLFQYSQQMARPGRLRVGYVSRLDTNKGASVLVAALGILKKEMFPLDHAVFVGHGSSEEVSLLKKSIKGNDLVKECQYAGAMTHSELADFFHKIDVMVFPTLYEESLGLVALEAMACGIPVIGSRIGALPDFIIEGKTGHLFEAGNAQELAEVIKRLWEGLQSGKDYAQDCRLMAEKYERGTLESGMHQWLLEKLEQST